MIKDPYKSKDPNYFGIGGWKFICSGCGDFYYIIDGCLRCKIKYLKPFIQRRIDYMKKNGIPIKAYQKRGRKAYYSRIMNKYKRGDKVGYRIMLKKLEERSKIRARYVKRRIKEYNRASTPHPISV
jgi:hypothetical protein